MLNSSISAINSSETKTSKKQQNVTPLPVEDLTITLIRRLTESKLKTSNNSNLKQTEYFLNNSAFPDT